MLHLSPTVTASVLITALVPTLPSHVQFARLLPSAEVVVKPKVRARASFHGENGEATRNDPGVSSLEPPSPSQNGVGQGAWLSGSDLTITWTRRLSKAETNGFAIFISADALDTDMFAACSWVEVSLDGGAQTDASTDIGLKHKGHGSTQETSWSTGQSVVAKLLVWDHAPTPRHALLSAALCVSLGSKGMVCESIYVRRAMGPLPLHNVKGVLLHPLRAHEDSHSELLAFNAKGKDARLSTLKRIQESFRQEPVNLLAGPLTDGMILPMPGRSDLQDWAGIGVKLNLKSTVTDIPKGDHWFLDEACSRPFDVCSERAYPVKNAPSRSSTQGVAASEPSEMAGLDDLSETVKNWLSCGASILLTGASGSGKTSLARLVGHALRQRHRFFVSFVECKRLSSNDAHLSAIREKLQQTLLQAVRATQLAEYSLVILDDLDGLCPAETELQVGQENERSRHMAELLKHALMDAKSTSSGIVFLATASGKDTLHPVITHAGTFHETLTLKAPDKDQRVKILALMTSKYAASGFVDTLPDEKGATAAHRIVDVSSSSKKLTKNESAASLDIPEIARRTDGYMPGDLVLLVKKGLTERVVRCSSDPSSTDSEIQTLDILKALKTFTPASLRNLPLTSSSTTFASIGGLDYTKAVLLETLQYPTTYAPIFQNCPLRLRSGILLFGYPGCGKTLLASAVAGECGLNFISVKGPEILNKYIGASEKSVRDLFERAEAAKPCVLFFDEFDSLAPKRGHDSTGVTDRVVNQLLTQLDGAEGLTGVYVLAATSRPDLIDPALLRPGRLDKSLLCDLPSVTDRLEILRSLTRNLDVESSPHQATSSPQMSLAGLAKHTEGFTGADLQAIVYNAHLLALHEKLGDSAKSTVVNKPLSEHLREEKTGRTVLEFPFDSNATLRGGSWKASSEQSTANLQVLRDLEAQKRARRAYHTSAAMFQDQATNKQHVSPFVPIKPKHLEAASTETRRSISELERVRLRSIYGDFLRSRSGEMPSGEGSTDVGVRSSLM